MPLSATTHWMIRNGGSDTANGGAFDPGQTAGMLTDGAATLATSTAPIFTSASYTFVAGDVGARVFIASGTNWRAGWYTITAVNAGAATLNATHEQYSLYPVGVSAWDGCATVASPTGATWSIDYSGMAATRFAYTDLASAGAGLTASSVAFPLAKAYVGNAIQIASGTNFTAGLYVLASVDVSFVGTFVGAANMTTGAGSDGVGGMGGAFATVGGAGLYHVGGNLLLPQYHATPYDSTSTTSNVASGRLTMAAGATSGYTHLLGWDTTPGDETGNRPTLRWGVNAASNFLVTGTSRTSIANVILDGNRANYTNPGGFSHGGGQGRIYNVKIMGCTVATSIGSATVSRLEQTNCTAVMGASTQSFNNCYFHDNTVGAITISTGSPTFRNCIFDTNGGAGITVTGAAYAVDITGCTFYGNTGAGVDITSAPLSVKVEGCIFESNTTHGVKMGGTYGGVMLVGNAYYNNGTANYSPNVLPNHQNIGAIDYTSTAFVDAANGDFRLNNAAGRALKIAGTPTFFPGLSWRNYSGVGASGSNPNNGRGGPFQPW